MSKENKTASKDNSDLLHHVLHNTATEQCTKSDGNPDKTSEFQQIPTCNNTTYQHPIHAVGEDICMTDNGEETTGNMMEPSSMPKISEENQVSVIVEMVPTLTNDHVISPYECELTGHKVTEAHDSENCPVIENPSLPCTSKPLTENKQIQYEYNEIAYNDKHKIEEEIQTNDLHNTFIAEKHQAASDDDVITYQVQTPAGTVTFTTPNPQTQLRNDGMGVKGDSQIEIQTNDLHNTVLNDLQKNVTALNQAKTNTHDVDTYAHSPSFSQTTEVIQKRLTNSSHNASVSDQSQTNRHHNLPSHQIQISNRVALEHSRMFNGSDVNENHLQACDINGIPLTYDMNENALQTNVGQIQTQNDPVEQQNVSQEMQEQTNKQDTNLDDDVVNKNKTDVYMDDNVSNNNTTVDFEEFRNESNVSKEMMFDNLTQTREPSEENKDNEKEKYNMKQNSQIENKVETDQPIESQQIVSSGEINNKKSSEIQISTGMNIIDSKRSQKRKPGRPRKNTKSNEELVLPKHNKDVTQKILHYEGNRNAEQEHVECMQTGYEKKIDLDNTCESQNIVSAEEDNIMNEKSPDKQKHTAMVLSDGNGNHKRRSGRPKKHTKLMEEETRPKQNQDEINVNDEKFHQKINVSENILNHETQETACSVKNNDTEREQINLMHSELANRIDRAHNNESLQIVATQTKDLLNERSELQNRSSMEVCNGEGKQKRKPGRPRKNTQPNGKEDTAKKINKTKKRTTGKSKKVMKPVQQFDPNIQYIIINRFKGVKEMRVELTKLNEEENNSFFYGCVKASAFEKPNKRKAPTSKPKDKKTKNQQISFKGQTELSSQTKPSYQFHSQTKSIKRKTGTKSCTSETSQLNIEIKEEVESFDEDENDGGDDDEKDPDFEPDYDPDLDLEQNDLEFLQIKEEPDIVTPPVRRRKKRIGRPPVFGAYECKKCDKSFKQKKLLLAHQRVHSIPKQSCRFCDFEAKSITVMMEHEAFKHTNEKPFKCDFPECPYASKSHTDLQRHKSKHSTEKKYKCPYEGCEFVTKWQRNIRHHVLRHTEERPFPCHLCQFAFKRKQDLRYHLYRHSEDKPIACDECDFRCKTNFELKCHKLKHSDVRNFACTHPGCTQRTKSKSDLTKHMKIHNTTKDYICDECGKGFNTKGCLSKHLQRHSDYRPFSCDICNRAFKVKVALRKHVLVHSEYRPYNCELCGQKFSSKSNKNVHMKTHDYSDRPYPCPVCPYAARIQSHLLSHIGSMHGDSYAYFCESCKKPFKRYGQLRIHHVRMHPEIDFGKLHTDEKIRMIKNERGQISYTFEENHESLINIDACIDSVIKETQQALKSEENEVLDNEYQNKAGNETKQNAPEKTSLVTNQIASERTINEASSSNTDDDSSRISSEGIIPDLSDLAENKDLIIQLDSEKMKENIARAEKQLPAADDNSQKDNKIQEDTEDLKGTNITSGDTNNTSEESKTKVRFESENEFKYNQLEIPPKASATLTIYDGGFRLPLATKGFKFNFDKTGKKPKSWFMNPDNMHKGPREHQMRYLAKKDVQYGFYLRAEKKKHSERNKILESLERRRKSAAKRFAVNDRRVRHKKRKLHFSKLKTEGKSQEKVTIFKERDVLPQNEESMIEANPVLPKLVITRKKTNSEKKILYKCTKNVKAEESDNIMNSHANDAFPGKTDWDQNTLLPGKIKKTKVTINQQSQMRIKLTANKKNTKKKVKRLQRGKEYTKSSEKNVNKIEKTHLKKNKNILKRTKNAKSKKSESVTSMKHKTDKTKNMLKRQKQTKPQPIEKIKAKKRGRPKASGHDDCSPLKKVKSVKSTKTPKTPNFNLKTKNKSPKKSSSKSRTAKGRKAKDQFLIEWERGEDQEDMLLDSQPKAFADEEGSIKKDIPMMKEEALDVLDTARPEQLCPVPVPESLRVAGSTTMEAATSIKLEPPDEARTNEVRSLVIPDSNPPSSHEISLPDDVVVMKNYGSELGEL